MDLLKGITVIDLSSVLAGPSVGTFFAELGARVIKVENSRFGGDVTRSWKLASEDQNSPISAYYASVNYGKEVHLLDLREAADRKIVDEWLTTADILIENFKHKDREKFGVDPDSIRQRFPQLIHCHLAGFAHDTDRVAYDVVLQAEGGFMSMNGQPGNPPTKMPLAFIDMLAAHQMKEGILLALYRRRSTGKGVYIKTSLEEAGIASLSNQATNYLMANHVAKQIGSKHPNIAPYGDLFTCKDGVQVVTAVGSDGQYKALCGLLGIPEAADDSRLATNPHRVLNREHLCETLQAAFKKFDANDILAQCHKEQIPIGAVRTIGEVCESTVGREMVLHEKTEGHPTSRMASVAFHWKE
ncbi:MAG: CoA transferase [Flavobacteriales bacterium]|nr:CoA transferase [Flavobacteriales bacterium]MDP4827786.1 CoA transferase [Flavobacteriales bacterium]